MSDIVERLRTSGPPYQSLKREAADEIERLRKFVDEPPTAQAAIYAQSNRMLKAENERLTAENALLLEQHAEVHANYNQAQDVIMSLRAALANSYCELCGCAKCLEREAAVNQSEQE